MPKPAETIEGEDWNVHSDTLIVVSTHYRVETSHGVTYGIDNGSGNKRAWSALTGKKHSIPLLAAEAFNVPNPNNWKYVAKIDPDGPDHVGNLHYTFLKDVRPYLNNVFQIPSGKFRAYVIVKKKQKILGDFKTSLEGVEAVATAKGWRKRKPREPTLLRLLTRGRI